MGQSSLISHISWKFQLCLLICSSAQVKMKFVVCVAVLVAVVSASYPPHPPPYYGPVHRGGYGGAGGHGGGIDPLTYLLLQKKGRFRRKRWRYPQSPPSPLVWWTRWWEEGRHRPLDLSARWWTWEVCRALP